ncbi:MAG TPA: GNAT family N-acetyltransferase [bacterium]|nr:GNAT family N-acetyltransferase [bacterium]
MDLNGQKFSYQLRHFGLAQALGRALADFRLLAKYHSLDFYFLELSSGPSVSSKKLPVLPGLTVREIKAEETRAFRFADGLLPPEEKWVEAQFARNSRLFAILEGDTVIGMNWINETFADLTHINRPRVPVPKGFVYSYRAAVAPSYRNRGIGTLLKQTLVKTLKDEGHRMVFLTVFLKDIVPHRWHRKNGFRKWGRVTYLDLRVTRFLWTRLTKEGRRCCPGLFHA